MSIKNCAIYTRVSTDNQAEKEFSSCQAQEEKIKSFVKSQEGWKVFRIYSDPGFTGANIERPGLQELLSDLKKEKIDMVLVYKIDRLTRSPKDFYQLIEFFEQSKIDFISVTERFDTSTPTGRLLRNIMLTFAQFERELASERTRDKMFERAKKGMWNGGIPPYGYQKINKKLAPHKKEAEIIKSIFDEYVEKKSLAKVYNLLKKQDIRNRQDNLFCKTVLAHILRNPVYVGKVRYADQIYQGLHQPIISEEVFDIAQKIHRKKMKNFRAFKEFLFGGLVKCKECGSHMTTAFTKKKTKGTPKRYLYYRCTATNKKDWSACTIKQISAAKLERYVLENLERISLDKEYIKNLVFRLNMTGRAGLEIKDKDPKFSSKSISSALKFFIFNLPSKTSLSKNLWAKRFIEKIIYSPQAIKIWLYYYPQPQETPNQKQPFPDSGRVEKAAAPQQKTAPTGRPKEFASYKEAPEPEFYANIRRLDVYCLS